MHTTATRWRRWPATLLMMLGFCLCAPSWAHSPHDDVFDVAVSSNYAEDSTVFAIVRSAFLVSRDGGANWKRMVRGLDHKNILYAFDLASDNRTLYLTSLGDGVYRSRDGGQDWSRLTPGPPETELDTVAVDPKKAEHVLVGGLTGGLYRSVDGGETWQDVTGDLDKVTAIAFHPRDPQRIYVATSSGALFESSDGASSWAPLHGPDPSDPITSLWVSDVDTDTPLVLAGTRSGTVLRRAEASREFSPVWQAESAEPVVAFGSDVAAGRDGRLYASLRYDGVYYSDDDGRSWQACSSGLTEDNQGPDLGRPSFGPLEAVETAAGERRVFLAGFDGLFRQDGDNCRWEQLETLSTSNIVGLAPSPSFSDDATLFATTWLWGVQISRDAGATWSTLNEGNMDYTRDNGLTRLFNIVFSPDFANDQTMFTSTWYRFLKSTNGGESWQQTKMLDDEQLRGRHHGLVIALSPNFRDDGTLYVGTHRGIILKSSDRGETFEIVKDTGTTIGGLVAVTGADSGSTVFAGDIHGVHRSADGGRTWQFSDLVGDHLHFEISPPPEMAAPYGSNFVEHLHVQRGKALGIKLAASPNYAEDQTVFAGTGNGLLITRDGGREWELADSGGLDAASYIEAVAVSPNFAEDGLVLVSVRGNGHFRSRDGGRTFTQVAPQLIDDQILLGHFPGVVPKFPAIVFSPTYAADGAVFGLYENQLLRSDDAGENWELLHTFSPTLSARVYVEARHNYRVFKNFVREVLGMNN